MVEVLVLIDAHCDVISGLPAFSGVRACVVDHNAFEVDLYIGLGQLVCLDYLVGEVRDVDSCVAFACNVELVIF